MIPIKSVACKLASMVCTTCALAVVGQQPSPAQASQASAPVLEQRNPHYILHRQDIVYLTFPLSRAQPGDSQPSAKIEIG
jgi:hypothetical protein